MTKLKLNLNFIKLTFCCRPAPKQAIMRTQRISFTRPSDVWLKNQIDKKEYATKSELVNDLIRQARKKQSQID